ncbi:probable G-protein coupled receptor 21 isoform X1 [Dreissena polymorpha]|uniref:G-protein coupled receptors family 1 profile domain-containing protein n=1 Tax=Dreissena polymorpha TaxID=45954 RepID=A0A9D4EYV8_DREPO|nr:probable G-protein coupled receptor 21 isoform X1 [Dreissena polymorpha]KAH3787993.1 hypothetical protein DPMN_166121 [Dreissena polymorpha]
MYGVMNQSMNCDGNTYVPTSADKLKCSIIVIVMILIVAGNVCCLVVFNHPDSRKLFMKRVRYIMTSMCCTDLGIGALVCPSTIYPALYHCWPPGNTICQIEALLISALFHESTLNMVVIAIDRYCVVHFRWYNTYMNSRRFLLVILATWVIVFSCYALVIFVWKQYYYDEFGINCEPFYENATVTLTVLSIFYFLPTVIFVFCYVSIFVTANRRKVFTVSSDEKYGRMVNANIRTSKYLAAITAGFFLAITPWTLMTLIIVAAKINIDHDIDYAITWLALSNSFWNCLIYGVMNRKFRRAALRVFLGRLMKSLNVWSTEKSVDKSTDDFEEGNSSTYSKYKRRTMNKKTCIQGVGSKASTSPMHSSLPSPSTTPLVQRKAMDDQPKRMDNKSLVLSIRHVNTNSTETTVM